MQISRRSGVGRREDSGHYTGYASVANSGLVVFAGDGFNDNMKSFLISTGKAIELCDLENNLRLFFNLPLD